MAKKEIKKHTLAEMKDRYVGRQGSEERNRYEYKLKMDVLGHLIKAARKEKKMTQTELGDLIGIQKSQISKIENNIHNVTIATVMKVFNALNADVHFTVKMKDKKQDLEKPVADKRKKTVV